MIYDIKTYRRIIKPQIKQFCDAKIGDPITHLSELALYTCCPIVIVAHLLGELYGYTPQLDEKIKELVKFYGPEEVINTEERV